MNVSTRPSFIADATDVRSDLGVVWHHPVFCQLALPMVLMPTPWHRVTDGLQLVFEASSGSDHEVLFGWALHYLLIVCVTKPSAPTARRRGSAPTRRPWRLPSAFGRRGGPAGSPHPDREPGGRQAERSLRAAAPGGGVRRPRAALPVGCRLATASAPERPLPCQPDPAGNAANRSIITALAAEPLALDAHGWIRHQLQHEALGQSTTTAWPELLCRVGSAGQEEQDFRAAFKDALRMVFAVDFSISLAADEEGVTVSALPPEAAAAVAVVPPSQDVAVAALAQALRSRSPPLPRFRPKTAERPCRPPRLPRPSPSDCGSTSPACPAWSGSGRVSLTNRR